MTMESDIRHALLLGIAKLDAPEIDPEDIANRLRRAATRANGIREAVRRAIEANSIESTMGATLSAILAGELAAEAFADVAEDIAAVQGALEAYTKASKAALARAIADSGAPRAATDTHYAVVAEGRGKTVVDDPDELPIHLWRHKSEPDLSKIARELDAGPVPGARRDASPPSLRILVQKQKVA